MADNEAARQQSLCTRLGIVKAFVMNKEIEHVPI